MLSEQLAPEARKMLAIACYISTHLGRHIPQSESARIYDCLTRDVTDAVMVKEITKENYAIERLKLSSAAPLPLDLFRHRTFVNGSWKDSIVDIRNKVINSDTDIFEGAINLRYDDLVQVGASMFRVDSLIIRSICHGKLGSHL